MRDKIFISYSHKDVRFRQRLEVHLKSITGESTFWSDKDIAAGDNWREEIFSAIDNAAIAILLVSADFMASDFIRNEELPRLFEIEKTEGIVIIPVMLYFCNCQDLLKYQYINAPDRPLGGLAKSKQEEVFSRLASVAAKQLALYINMCNNISFDDLDIHSSIGRGLHPNQFDSGGDILPDLIDEDYNGVPDEAYSMPNNDKIENDCETAPIERENTHPRRFKALPVVVFASGLIAGAILGVFANTYMREVVDAAIAFVAAHKWAIIGTVGLIGVFCIILFKNKGRGKQGKAGNQTGLLNSLMRFFGLYPEYEDDYDEDYLPYLSAAPPDVDTEDDEETVEFIPRRERKSQTVNSLFSLDRRSWNFHDYSEKIYDDYPATIKYSKDSEYRLADVFTDLFNDRGSYRL